jgi:DNA polymerase-3 subunit alpha
MKAKAPNRFFGLHSHSGFSTFDGLGYPQEHIDFCRKNELDGWSLTDHGHMNGFAHAYLHTKKLNKAGANFKFIPGCEMYFHPDIQEWQAVYDLRKAAKKGNKEAVNRILDENESIRTRLIATLDGHDETIMLEVEDGNLTVENEDETKSAKFYDPIKRRHHLVVLPKTSEGLQRLFGLVSKGYLEGFYRFPRIDVEMLKEAATGGHLMVTSACIGGPLAFEVFKHLQQHDFENLKSNLLDDQSIMDKVQLGIGNAIDKLAYAVGRENVMLELQFNKLEAQHLANRAIIEFANRQGMTDQLIVTCDSHYSSPDHWKEREIYKKLGWMKHNEFNPENLPQSKDDLKCELYPKNANQVWDTYQEIKDGHNFYDDFMMSEAVERTHDIAHEMIGDIHPETSMKLPSYVIPENMTANKALLEACKKGIVARGLSTNSEYINRLHYELKVIKEKNFAEYFLTMKAIMDIAKDNMLVGPARGSGAGSLVNYVLYITDIDPIEYDLLFERFLSIDRSDAPDIDNDVADRDKLISLLRKEFGDLNVIPISNYNTFKLKSLIKDVSKFYGIPYDEVNKALAPLERDVRRGRKGDAEADDGFDINLGEAIKYSDSLKGYLEKHPEVVEPIGVLFKQNKALGRHAGGVIVSENIQNQMPIILARGEPQTPWVEGMNYKHLEEFGWIKFDILGLETLRIIERSIDLIIKKETGKDPTFLEIKSWFDSQMAPKNIDFNDQKVYKNIYHAGRWAAIFQCTQRGTQAMFKRAKPESVVDIATLTAIYRPGPLSAKVDKLYISNKKNPESVDYGHPLIKEVLEETYGCIIFQEQVMKLCNLVAGIPKAECNAMRKMMKPMGSGSGDENIQKARALKDKFISGAISNGISEPIAKDLYEKILYFAGYGFNKSHAVAYAVNSYYCAWLMTYYEQEWIQAYLEASSTNPKKLAKALGEVKGLGYKIAPIDINHAGKRWSLVEDKTLMPSFVSCKGLGAAAVDEILQNRPYSKIEDLLWNEDGSWKHSKFNKRALDALIKIRAFSSMDLVGSDGEFSSYKHMHNVVMENYDQLRRRLKKDPFMGMNAYREFLLESTEVEEWHRKEIMDYENDLLGSINVEALVPQQIMEKLKNKGVKPLDDHDGLDLYWFMVSSVLPKLTKNKKPYFLINSISASGKIHRMFCWGVPAGATLDPYTFCVAEIDKNDFGMSTKWHRIKTFDF